MEGSASADLGFLNKEGFLQAEHILHDVVSRGLRFKMRERVYDPTSYESLFLRLVTDLPEMGQSLQSLLDDVQNGVVAHSTNYSSPMAMAFPDAGNSIAAMAGALLSDLINQNLINWVPCAPAATVVEVATINWLRQLIGYEHFRPEQVTLPSQTGGVVTSGGVASNTVAQLVAREKVFPGAMRQGVAPGSGCVIVPEGIDHYSSRLAAGWLGIGEDSVRRCPTRDFKYDLGALQSLLACEAAAGRRAIQIVAYAGDSRTMTCDDFPALRTIADAHGAWLHVDACHGSQLLFSSKLRGQVAGIELADSVTFDPHKVLCIPYALSMVVFKRPSDLEALRRPEDIITGELHSFGQATPLFGSRPFASLKLYMVIRHLGARRLGEMIERRHAIACRLAQMLSSDPDFLLVNPDVHINSVAFMYWPECMRSDPATCATQLPLINQLNVRIQKRLFDSGEVWLHNFQLPDLHNVVGLGRTQMLRPLRFMSGNPLLRVEQLQRMIELVRKQGEAER